MNTITYRVKNGIYINLTNKCSNNCAFCLRNYGPSAYGSDTLWLDREPTADEVVKDFEKYDPDSFEEIVYCGYGEPTEALDVLIKSAKALKELYGKPIRINTNGQSDLINSKSTAPLFKDIIDTISISMNCSDAKKYDALCKPKYGEKAYDAMLSFGKECVKYVDKVIFTVVDTTLSDEEKEICKAKADEIGVKFRVRAFEKA